MIRNIESDTSANMAGGGTPPPTLGELEQLAKKYEYECTEMETSIARLEADLDQVRQKHLAGLKRQAGIVARREADLHSAIEQAPGLFLKPRTLVLHGVKVGFTSSPGRIEFDDGEQVIKLVERHFPDRYDELVREKPEPNKDALRNLAADELKKIGCRIEGAGDQVILKRVAGDVERLVNKLIEKLVAAMVSPDPSKN